MEESPCRQVVKLPKDLGFLIRILRYEGCQAWKAMKVVLGTLLSAIIHGSTFLEYFDAICELRLMQERLFHELPYEHEEQRLRRQRKWDQYEIPFETREEFEEKCRQEVVKVGDGTVALRLRVDGLRAQAVSAGLDPDPYTKDNLDAWNAIAGDWEPNMSPDDGTDMFTQCHLPAVDELAEWNMHGSVLDLGAGAGVFARSYRDSALRDLAYKKRDLWLGLEPDSMRRMHNSTSAPRFEASQVTEQINMVSQDCVAAGWLNGKRVEALADSCAGNFISTVYLRNAGLHYQKVKQRDIVIGNGQKAFKTLGTVRLAWQFGKERDTKYNIDFDVIPSRFCDYSVTLGGKFLAATKTLTERLKDRIIRRFRRSAIPRLFYQGGSHLRMSGYCGGVPVAALADTGSDLDLVSPKMLLRLGYDQRDVLTSDAHCVHVELPGGLTVRTSGMIRGVDFRFGNGRAEDSYLRDFYILPGLPGDVLIGQDLLWESDAFSRYPSCMAECDDDFLTEDVPEGMFLNIKLVRETRSLFTSSKKRATNEADLEAHKQWEAQCKSVLDEVEDMHRREMEEEARKDEILKLEQKYRQLMQSPAKPVTPAGRSHKPRPAPPLTNSPAMVQGRNSAGHVASTGTANT
ncbi:hypothetical protein CBER1_07174 [Cercospora berteroae]|uniref:Uncharacterized protein n=1 Tax=Cercospora berteroae TaxID=357750 RepID=A0A2S6BRX5_9PEZI|nr:hypothetical protein CBER1_07174 [Cercospora berteroae]